MQRDALQRLINWKGKTDRKPLVIQGARQVGKTWLMREFGRLYYAKTVYVNFDSQPEQGKLFAPNLDTQRIISSLSLQFHTDITPKDTLVIFDEVQECNRALVSLKYFRENAPEYHIIAAGSFLGVAAHDGSSFPVGKVDMLTLYPLSFLEFLRGIGEEGLADAARSLDYALITGLKSRFIELLKHYFYIGGMPDAVLSFSRERSFEQVREVQRAIVHSYQADFSKHIQSADIPKTLMVWNSIPAQLARENKKFVYSDVKQSARAREYENALTWLTASGLAYRVNRVSLPNLPLISYVDAGCFKLYMLDVGLLSARSALDIKTLLEPSAALFNHFKGALTEQFVLQELKALDDDLPIFYWTNAKNTAEVDFIIQK
jgi:predicted AAA+ superfamily ATPase